MIFLLGVILIKIISMVNDIPIEQLTKSERQEFEKSVLKRLEDAGLKIHTKSNKRKG